jgi:hypothetical protein
VTECQGCGAWNDTSRTLCVLCGTPLAATDEWDAAAELPPLPPLPDGGLAASMPTWLRDPPSLSSPPELPLVVAQAPGSLGPKADPRTFLSDDDFPQWLRDLAARRDETVRPVAMQRQSGLPLAAWSNWPESGERASVATPTTPPVELEIAPPSMEIPSATTQTPVAMVAAHAGRERRERGVWETLLLVFLFIGVIVAALWALVANGVFSPGL